ncbi:beta-ketoacyl synthase N-terminal-like domain-containing protein [Rhizosphaericola mali]|uniref:3-oxoacyl-[acyl-carrier-protein] synthase 1 n=1 Tax=Rhizosphaericola mali TaxID=2545455 RepID=A0A5P2G986_9BACT|nr:beta-ketoacyl synthase N-terminal-like domain-containing protein [Rhizosphaericola mali]QES90280.1 beta-ketoacyl-[acyl-carrier-protein] synthase family protein [Rhizosphaericola mali]
MQDRRVVITGIGVVAPNGVNKSLFLDALKKGKTNFKKISNASKLGLGCEYAAIPELSQEAIDNFCKKYRLVKIRSSAVIYGCMAGMEAWLDAGLEVSEKSTGEPLWNAGCIFNSSCGGVEAFAYNYKLAKAGDFKKMGGRVAQQAMNSGISAYMGGILGLGNQVTTYASESNSGTESIINAYNRIKWGLGEIMLAGSTESSSEYVFGLYDTTQREDNSHTTIETKNLTSEEIAMHCFEENAPGGIYGAGAGALVLESLESAINRGAKIYAEILGTNLNSGGQRNDKGLLGLDEHSLEYCIKNTIKKAKINPAIIDLVAGSYPSDDYCQKIEFAATRKALQLTNKSLPYFNTTKSLIGACLAASGAIEAVAAILELNNNFIHGTPRIGDISLDILTHLSASKIPSKMIRKKDLSTILHVNYGVGDVYSSYILKKWKA